MLATNLPGGLAGPLRFDRFVAQSFALAITPPDDARIERVFAAEPDVGVTLPRCKLGSRRLWPNLPKAS